MRGTTEKFIYCDRQANAGAEREWERERERERARERWKAKYFAVGEQASCMSPWKHFASLWWSQGQLIADVKAENQSQLENNMLYECATCSYSA